MLIMIFTHTWEGHGRTSVHWIGEFQKEHSFNRSKHVAKIIVVLHKSC